MTALSLDAEIDVLVVIDVYVNVNYVGIIA